MASDAYSNLIERARRGEREAAQRLLGPYLQGLETFVERRLDPSLAQKSSAADIVQSACCDVLVDLPRFDSHGEGRAAFRSWLFRSALRKLRDRQRHYLRQKRDVDRELPQSRDPIAELYRSTVTPSRRAIRAEERQRVSTALGRLPDGYREVIRLAYFEALSRREIGERLGKSEDAVHSLLARALARLARVLAEEPGPAGRSR